MNRSIRPSTAPHTTHHTPHTATAHNKRASAARLEYLPPCAFPRPVSTRTATSSKPNAHLAHQTTDFCGYLTIFLYYSIIRLEVKLFAGRPRQQVRPLVPIEKEKHNDHKNSKFSSRMRRMRGSVPGEVLLAAEQAGADALLLARLPSRL